MIEVCCAVLASETFSGRPDWKDVSGHLIRLYSLFRTPWSEVYSNHNGVQDSLIWYWFPGCPDYKPYLVQDILVKICIFRPSWYEVHTFICKSQCCTHTCPQCMYAAAQHGNMGTWRHGCIGMNPSHSCSPHPCPQGWSMPRRLALREKPTLAISATSVGSTWTTITRASTSPPRLTGTACWWGSGGRRHGL